jgi:hypothetical protein
VNINFRGKGFDEVSLISNKQMRIPNHHDNRVALLTISRTTVKNWPPACYKYRSPK